MLKGRKVWAVAIMVAVGVSVFGSVYAQDKAKETTGKDTGLLVYLKFDDGSGDVAKDSSGNGNEGTLNGAEWVKGKFGTALSFNGSDAYVSVPEPAGLDGSNEMTVECWVYWESTGRYPNIITGGTWSPGGFLIFVIDNACQFRMGRPGVSAEEGGEWKETGVNMISNIAFGQWYYLVATFKKPVVKAYVNGLQTGTASWDFSVGQAGEILIGKWAGDQPCHAGLIDEVKIYKRALTTAEIKESFDKEKTNRIAGK